MLGRQEIKAAFDCDVLLQFGGDREDDAPCHRTVPETAAVLQRGLPADYAENRKAWRMADLFQDWFLKIEKQMRLQKCKVALAVDNCSVHSKMLKLEHVEVVSLPPNCIKVPAIAKPGHHKICRGPVSEEDAAANHPRSALQA